MKICCLENDFRYFSIFFLDFSVLNTNYDKLNGNSQTSSYGMGGTEERLRNTDKTVHGSLEADHR